MRLALTLFLLSLSFCSLGQMGYGVYGGISVDLGNKQTRFGLVGGGYVNYNYIQLNVKAGGYYNLKSIGIGATTVEGIIGAGLVGAYGARDSSKITFNTLSDNNTYRKNSFGYAWNYYWDGQQTSQSTGTIMLGFDKIQIACENDLFGGKSGLDDRYRTGAIHVSYQYEDFELVWKHILYTGDLQQDGKIFNTTYPARFGYVDDKNSKYADKSHGISAIEVRYKLRYEQVVSASLGVNSEWVRFIAQNWLIHDSYYIPTKWIKYPNLHIPMVANDGTQYLFKEGQKVKSTSVYFDLGMNSTLFY
ncbi:MAG: hypothetical protein JKY42_06015 [Flavobacteriales bacterium]|nr:hypothetical protein [Flavobacteriales bacterium]